MPQTELEAGSWLESSAYYVGYVGLSAVSAFASL